MLLTIHADQIQQIIPDANSEKAAKKLAKLGQWNERFSSEEQWIWAQIQGSSIYQSAIYLPQMKCECSCPSFKRPCKHALALLMVYAEHPDQFTPHTAEHSMPSHVEKWRNKINKVSEKIEKPSKPVDAAAQQKRQDAREQKMHKGMQALSIWLEDLVNLGLSQVRSQNQPQFFHEMSSRLVDAQTAGINYLLYELSSSLYQEDWQSQSRYWLSKLHLVTVLWQQKDQLSLPMQQELRQLLGVNMSAELWENQAKTSIEFVQLGSEIQPLQQAKGFYRRQWLWDSAQCQDYLILDYSIPPYTQYGMYIQPQSLWQSQVQFYPAVTQQRLRLVDESKIQAQAQLSQAPVGFADFQHALNCYAEKLKHFALHTVSFWWVNQLQFDYRPPHFALIDQQQRCFFLELEPRVAGKLYLLVGQSAFSAGLTWDGRQLKLISIWQGAHFQCL